MTPLRHSGRMDRADELPLPDHTAPEGVPDAIVDAVGKLTGSADIELGEAARMLREAGRDDVAERIERDLIGRNVIAGRWTFQIVEDYDDGYWSLFRQVEREVREQLVGGRRHIFEARMKQDERTEGEPGHEATPGHLGEET